MTPKLTPGSSTPAGDATLDARYGRRTAPRSKVLVALIAVLVGAGLSWLAWVMLTHGRPLAQSELVSFDATGVHAVDAEFTVVRRDASVEASCLLRAFSSDHATVGELNVAVGADQPTTSTLTRTIRTERLATSVEMVGCTAEGQSRRR
jgi:hypothetical protein